MPTREELHARLDAQCDAKRHELEQALAKLEEERESGHEWIEAVPDTILTALAGADFGFTAAASLVVGEAKSGISRIQLYEPIKHLIRSLDPEREITSAIVYDALRQTIPELALEDQRKLRARIAGTLTRLVEEKILRVWKSGSGSMPHTYKIKGEGYQSVMDALNDGAKIQS